MFLNTIHTCPALCTLNNNSQPVQVISRLSLSTALPGSVGIETKLIVLSTMAQVSELSLLLCAGHMFQIDPNRIETGARTGNRREPPSGDAFPEGRSLALQRVPSASVLRETWRSSSRNSLRHWKHKGTIAAHCSSHGSP